MGRDRIREAWREATSPVFDTSPLAGDDGFDASITAFNLEGILIAQIGFGASHFERCPPRFAAGGNAGISIQQYLSGSISGRVGDHELHMRPDAVHLQDLGIPFVGRAPRSTLLTIIVPRHLIVDADRLGPLRPTVCFPLATARGALLSANVRLLWDELCAGRVFDPVTVATGFLGLVNGLVSAIVRPSEPHASEAMEHYVRCHLGDVSLGVDHLQRAFFCSRSTVYRLFESHGGVAAFIRNERLRRCHAELLRAGERAIQIRTVAARFGFHDPAQFSRAFRRRYDVTPSELAALAAKSVESRTRSGVDLAPVDTIRSWLSAV